MIVFKEKAKQDIYNAKGFYLDISKEITSKFVKEIEKSVKLIEKFPDLGSGRYSDYSKKFVLRFCILKTFPYMIFYYKKGEDVFIIRILHMSMDISHHLYF